MDEIFGLDDHGVPIVPNVLVDMRALTEAWTKERDVNSGPGPGHNLRNYWLHGEGAAKIRWNTDGDWTRCVRHLSKYVKDPKGLCSEYHHQATGMWTGEKRHLKRSGDTVTLNTEMLYDEHRAAEGGDMTAAAAKTKSKKQNDEEPEEKATDEKSPKFQPIDEYKPEDTPSYEDDDEVDTDAEADSETTDEEEDEEKSKAAPVAAEMDRPAKWEGVLTVEGIESGDGRMFGTNALTWDELPLPLRWQKESAHGGQNDVTVSVGNIEKIWREPAPDGRAGVTFIKGAGTIDLGNPDGAEVYRRMKRGYMRGNSVDVDSVKGADVELVFPESTAKPADKDGEKDDEKDTLAIFDMSRMQPELTIYKKGRIRATTLVEIPAFTEARLALASDEDTSVAPEETDVEQDDSLVQAVNDQIDAIVAAATMITVPDLPPREWFEEPKDVMATGALTVTQEGRIFGYVAPLGVRHRSFTGKDVTVPMRRVDYTRFMGGETIVADGGRVSTGAITMNCGHASTSPTLTAAQAAQHYDNTCSMVATVRVGENRHGVWMAGALLPDVTPDQIRRIMASRLSGDWRAHLDKPGWREFVAALLVPVPGFPMARTAPSVTASEGVLVASSVPVFFAQQDEDETDVEMKAKEMENCHPKMRVAAAAERIKAAKLAALRDRVSQHMPSPTDRAAALRSRVVSFAGETAFRGFDPKQPRDGEGKWTDGPVGKAKGLKTDIDKLRKQVSGAKEAADKASAKVNGGSAKDRFKDAGPDGWAPRKDGGAAKHNPHSGGDHRVMPAEDGSGKWVHRYVGKGESSVTGTRHNTKEEAMKDADRVINRDAEKSATGPKASYGDLLKMKKASREAAVRDLDDATIASMRKENMTKLLKSRRQSGVFKPSEVAAAQHLDGFFQQVQKERKKKGGVSGGTLANASPSDARAMIRKASTSELKKMRESASATHKTWIDTEIKYRDLKQPLK